MHIAKLPFTKVVQVYLKRASYMSAISHHSGRHWVLSSSFMFPNLVLFNILKSLVVLTFKTCVERAFGSPLHRIYPFNATRHRRHQRRMRSVWRLQEGSAAVLQLLFLFLWSSNIMANAPQVCYFPHHSSWHFLTH